jgi:hypothetical protein
MKRKLLEDYMIISAVKRVLKALIIAGLGLIAMGIIGFGVLGAFLLTGPLNLTFLKSHIVERVLIKGADLDFQNLHLEWPSIKGPLYLRGSQITYARDDALKASIAQLSCTYPLGQVLKFNLLPQELDIEGAHIIIKSLNSSLPSLPPPTVLDAVFEDITQMTHIRLTDSSLMIKGHRNLIFDISARLVVQGPHLTGFLKATGRGQKESLGLLLTSKDAGETLDCTFAATNFTPENLSLILSKPLDSLAHFSDFTTLIAYHYAPYSQTPHRAELKGKIIGLALLSQDNNKEPLPSTSLDFTGVLLGSDIALAMSTTLEKAYLTLHSYGHWASDAETLKLKTSITLTQFSIKDLKKYWPQNVAVLAREWITKNITGGTLPHADLLMATHHTFSEKGSLVRVDSLKGFIDISKATLSYLETMPKISELNAIARFDAEHFDIALKSGLSHGLKITGGNLIIGNFSDPTIKLSLTVNLNGKLSHTLSLIDSKPLEYAKAYTLKPEGAAGQIKALLAMTFPLEIPFNPKLIETNLKATVQEATLKELADLEIDLTQGSFAVTVNPKEILVKGKGHLNGVLSQIFFHQLDAPQRLTLKVDQTITEDSLAKLWPGAPLFFKGSAPLKLTYIKESQNKALLTLNANMTQAELNTLVFKKISGEKASLELEAHLENRKFVDISKALLITDNRWNVSGTAFFIPKTNALKSVQARWMQNDREMLKTTLTQEKGAYTLNLEANTLDLSLFRDTDLSSLNSSKTDWPSITVISRASKVTFGKPVGFVQNVLNTTIEKGRVRTLTYEGFLESSSEKERKIFANITTDKKNLRKLRLYTANAGLFLKTLDVFDNVQGGQLRVLAFHDPTFKGEDWVGSIKVEECALMDAPFLSRFFSLAFPTGITDLTQGGGMRINTAKVRFGASDKYFNIHGLRAYGNSLGFSLTGQIERKENGSVNLSGNMIPAYIINSLLSKIPLIGQILSGPNSDGLFAISFTITGPKSNPTVTANPLSAFTPGILRDLFFQRKEHEDEDDWLNQEKDLKDIFDQEFKKSNSP